MNKKYIILFSVMIIYFLVIFGIFGVSSIKKERREAIILIDTETSWKLEKNNLTNIDNEDLEDEIAGKKFNVFIDNKKLGNYYLTKNNTYLLRDDTGKQIDYDLGSFLAINTNYNIAVLNLKTKKNQDRSYIDKVLSENNLNDIEAFTVDNYYQIDFDNDQVIENFYTISNAFARETSPKKVFTIAFMEKNGSIYYLYKAIENNDGQNGCKPYLNSLIDIDEDQVYEIVLSCGYYSVEKRLDMLYSFKDNQFKLLLSNQ